jgi:hypothetical protein
MKRLSIVKAYSARAQQLVIEADGVLGIDAFGVVEFGFNLDKGPVRRHLQFQALLEQGTSRPMTDRSVLGRPWDFFGSGGVQVFTKVGTLRFPLAEPVGALEPVSLKMVDKGSDTAAIIRDLEKILPRPDQSVYRELDNKVLLRDFQKALPKLDAEDEYLEHIFGGDYRKNVAKGFLRKDGFYYTRARNGQMKWLWVDGKVYK